MSEREVIQRTNFPLTVQSLAEHLRECGVTAGQTVLVHMAMSKLNYVIGGAQAVVMALLDALGENGTLMMPTHTTYNTNPSEWQHPPVPESWWQPLRDHTPAYDPATSPTREMGVVPELFRTWPGTQRSLHPVLSFAARGPNAQFLLADHALEEDIGNRSPVGRLYELDGFVLLLGVGHANNTSLHLAEFRADYPGKKSIPSGCAMLVNGRRQWVEYESLQLYPDDFDEVGAAFDLAQQIRIGRIADAEVRFFRQRTLVDFAAAWMEKHRNLTGI
jgi:aminoglycoside 3-N-acetyltransferase